MMGGDELQEGLCEAPENDDDEEGFWPDGPLEGWADEDMFDA